MSKYFIVFRPHETFEVNAPHSREELACNIFSKVRSGKESDFFLAYEESSSMATFSCLKKTAIASLEIDSALVSFWENEVLPIYEAEAKFEKFISFSLDQILLESIEFDRVIYRSNEFKSIQSADDMSFRFALDCLSDKARPKINKVVASKFKIQIF